jgi:hypothetical protein
MRSDLAQANKEQILMKQAEHLKDLEDERRVEEHARKRSGLEAMRKEKEEQRFQEKLDTR